MKACLNAKTGVYEVLMALSVMSYPTHILPSNKAVTLKPRSIEAKSSFSSQAMQPSDTLAAMFLLVIQWYISHTMVY